MNSYPQQPISNPYFNSQFYNPQPMWNMPQMSQPQPVQQNENVFIWTQGKESAMAYPMVPDKTLLFLDDQKPYVYKKRTDKEGKTVEFRTYKLVDVTDQNNSTDASSYVTKDEFATLSKQFEELKTAVQQRNNSYNKNYKKG